MNTTTATVKKQRHSPTKYTPWLRRKILKMVSIGMPISHIPPACGLSLSGFFGYRKRSPKFEAAIQRAISRGIERHLGLIAKAAEEGDVASSRWFLERCHSEFFGRTRLEVTGAGGGPVGVATVVLTWPHQQNQYEKVIDTTAENRIADAAPDAD